MSRVLRGVLECVRASSGAGSSPAALFAAASLSQSGWVSGTRTWASYGQDLQDEAPSTSYSTTTTRRNPRSLGRPLASSPSPYPRVSESVKPLTVQYPFPIEYDVDRTTLVRSLITGQPIGVQSLPGSIFNVPVRVDVLHRCVRYLRSLWQQGTHKAKSRAEVSGGGRKPRPQKKTGRSRQGSIRSPLWKGGGVALGPSPRSHAHQMHATTRLLGMKCALSAKVNEGRLIVLDSLLPPVASLTIGGAFEPAPSTVPPKGSSRSGGAAAAASPKTKHMRQALEALLEGVPARTVLLVDCGRDGGDGGAMLRRAADNLTWVTILAAQDVTVYHLLKHHALVVSRPALQALTARLEGALRVKRPVRSAWWLTQQAAFRLAEAKLRGVTA